MLMGVYGTLRKGFGNYNYFLKGKKCVGTIEVEGLRMYSLGFYPCVVHTGKKEDKIIMEVYELNEKKDLEIIGRIDSMELGAGYSIEKIKTKLGDVRYYAFPHIPDGCPHVESGDWKKYSD